MEAQIANEVAKATLTGLDLFVYILAIIGSFASIFGIMASGYAAVQANKSKKAAEKASERAKEIGDAIFTFQNLASFDSMLALYETVKQSNIEGNNPVKLYPHIRTSLIHFKSLIPINEIENLAKVQDFLVHLTQCEHDAAKAKISEEKIETEKINRILTGHTVEIQLIISEMRKKAGENLR